MIAHTHRHSTAHKKNRPFFDARPPRLAFVSWVLRYPYCQLHVHLPLHRYNHLQNLTCTQAKWCSTRSCSRRPPVCAWCFETTVIHSLFLSHILAGAFPQDTLSSTTIQIQFSSFERQVSIATSLYEQQASKNWFPHVSWHILLDSLLSYMSVVICISRWP